MRKRVVKYVTVASLKSKDGSELTELPVVAADVKKIKNMKKLLDKCREF